MTTLRLAASCARSLRALLLIAAALAIGGCAPTTGPRPGSMPDDARGTTASPLPVNAEPPAPKINLQGFPLPYRQGYADGCASAAGPERKDAARYSADGNYRTGWQDGAALCRKP